MKRKPRLLRRWLLALLVFGAAGCLDDCDACEKCDSPAMPSEQGDGAGDQSQTDAAVDAALEMPTTIRAALAMSPQFRAFAGLVELSELGGFLDKPNSNLTVFAPSNSAFAALSNACINQLRGDPDRLRQFVRHHIALGLSGLTLQELTQLAGFEIPMASGWSTRVTLPVGADAPSVGGVPVGERLEAGGNTLFILDDAPLMPPELAADACVSDG